jgi:hypothetical protein
MGFREIRELNNHGVESCVSNNMPAIGPYAPGDQTVKFSKLKLLKDRHRNLRPSRD